MRATSSLALMSSPLQILDLVLDVALLHVQKSQSALLLLEQGVEVVSPSMALLGWGMSSSPFGLGSFTSTSMAVGRGGGHLCEWRAARRLGAAR